MRIVLVAIGCAFLAGCAVISPEQFKASDGQSVLGNYQFAVISQVDTDKALLGQGTLPNYTKLALTGTATH